MEPGSGRAAPATDRQALAMAILVTWIVGASYFVIWADSAGQLENDFFTQWHVPLYLGFGAVVVYLIGLARRAVSQRHPRGLVPSEFTGTVIGAAMVVLYLPFDVIWASLAGVPQDFERTTAVPRLFLGVAFLALASGPMVAALRRPPQRRVSAAALSVVLAAGSIGGTIALFSGGWTPVILEAGLRPTGDVVPGTEPIMELHRVTIDGSVDEVITTGPDLREPAESRDGSQIAAVWWDQEPGDPGFKTELVVMRADGTDRRILTNDGEWKGQPSWSPNGSKIAYMATAAVSQPSQAPESFGPQQAPPPAGQLAPLIVGGPYGDWDVKVVDVATGQTTAVATGASQEGRPAWSPDGSQLAYYSTQAGSFDLWLLDVTTNESTRLTDDPAEDWAASWSPDGTTILFTSNRDGEYRVYSVDVESRAVARLTDGPNADWTAAYSPDGKWIAFTSRRVGKPELWAMRTDGSGIRRLTNTLDRYPEMTVGAWTPDSSAIIYTSQGFAEDEQDDRLPIASFALIGAIAGIAIGLLFAVGVTLPFGATTALLFALGAAPLALAQPRWLPAAIVAGLAVDVAAWLTRRRPQTTVRTAGLAALGAAAWSIAFFVIGDQTGDMRWEFNLLASGVALAGLAAFAAAAAIASGRSRTAAAD